MQAHGVGCIRAYGFGCALVSVVSDISSLTSPSPTVAHPFQHYSVLVVLSWLMAAILAKADMEGALFHYDECTHVFFPDMLKQKFLSLFLSKCKMFAEKNTVLRINPLFQTCSKWIEQKSFNCKTVKL